VDIKLHEIAPTQEPMNYLRLDLRKRKTARRRSR
jgi:hypothetical protein